ncbi:MAG TPA: tRNA guanosine(34) transglycosylase Tgt [Candidatus Marinimicrobia bacterium]|nr:tRNA guanosine(34) transglycosylase Tgt [Candidatus Neomarinimicrobiota bacterium]
MKNSIKTQGRIKFAILAKDPDSLARACRFETDHGTVETPIFMPVGTHGVVKTLTPAELDDCQAQIILGNTYHLYLRPGLEIIEKGGGLHRFSSWNKPMLTDSGGFQVFSLAHLGKMTEDDITFRSHIDGSQHILSPEISMEIQNSLGSDIMMAFDECTPYPCDYEYAAKSLERTHRWEQRSKEHFDKLKPHYGHQQFLFGIVQGSVYPDLRVKSVEVLTNLEFDGYAIGGLAVGEPKAKMFELLSMISPLLPENKPHYLMGVGKPEDIIRGIEQGIDMFDCVLPTRNARNGTLYTWNGRIVLKQAQYRMDFTPPDESCNCYTCRNFSRAYLRHLYMNGEMTGLRLNTLHNIHFFLEVASKAREAIKSGVFLQWKKKFFEIYTVEDDHWEENTKRREERRQKHIIENNQANESRKL